MREKDKKGENKTKVSSTREEAAYHFDKIGEKKEECTAHVWWYTRIIHSYPTRSYPPSPYVSPAIPRSNSERKVKKKEIKNGKVRHKG